MKTSFIAIAALLSATQAIRTRKEAEKEVVPPFEDAPEMNMEDMKKEEEIPTSPEITEEEMKKMEKVPVINMMDLDDEFYPELNEEFSDDDLTDDETPLETEDIDTII
mmetsp:Transcript_6818/g.11500  ORF Transcript_6818/g.11500 Transcript_6818/m.11500 type:complete len:108 (-) Transcript_6818:316-639(-)